MPSKTDQAKADSRTHVQGGERAPTQEHGELEVKKGKEKVGEGRSIIRDIGSSGSGGGNWYRTMANKDRAKRLGDNIYHELILSTAHSEWKHEKYTDGQERDKIQKQRIVIVERKAKKIEKREALKRREDRHHMDRHPRGV